MGIIDEMCPDFDYLPDAEKKKFLKELRSQERQLVNKALRQKYPDFENFSLPSQEKLYREMKSLERKFKKEIHNWDDLPLWRRVDLLKGLK